MHFKMQPPPPPPPPYLRASLEGIKTPVSDDDPVVAIKAEITSWIETLLNDHGLDDPVFEGMVKHFRKTTESYKQVLNGVDSMVNGIESLCQGLTTVADALVSCLGKSDHRVIASDCCKLKECTNNICRIDAPYSIVAKLKRDLEFNVRDPLQAHLSHSRSLETQLKKRRQRLRELSEAKREFEKESTTASHKRKQQLQQNMDLCRSAFEEVDRPVFEWLLMLQEYEADIYDSLIQTIKYLQYEFFAGAAHYVSSVLPKKMEFRPLVEMTPRQLEPQVEMELNECRPELEQPRNIDKICYDSTSNQRAPPVQADQYYSLTTTKILRRCMQGTDPILLQTTATPGSRLDTSLDSLPVDPLSLAALVSQGFDEEAARRALKRHGGEDAQAALDCLLEVHVHADESEGAGAAERAEVAESVRIPSTLKWIQKLKDHRSRKSRQTARQIDPEKIEEEPRPPEDDNSLGPDSSSAGGSPGGSPSGNTSESRPNRHESTKKKKKKSFSSSEDLLAIVPKNKEEFQCPSSGPSSETSSSNESELL